MKWIGVVMLAGLLFGGMLWLSPPAQALSGFPQSNECRWFGTTIGVRGQAWEQVAGSRGQVERLINKHCNTRHCQRMPRGHWSMVYEVMPCGKECFIEKSRQYREVCM
ncbi:MAG: hypothetical protein HQL52_07755 [Magnetococcales bacterium]|nr:hypothetical protein [Magnetococcales bacterium]